MQKELNNDFLELLLSLDDLTDDELGIKPQVDKNEQIKERIKKGVLWK